MQKALEGRIALVTGASRGIGVGIARCMAEEGARVAVAARSEAGLKQTCRQIEAIGAEALAVPADVGVEGQVVDMLERVERAWGPVELLVNNAGVHGDDDWSDHYPEETRDWEKAYRVNMLSRVWACDRVLPTMRERRWGRIVNVSSIAGLEGFQAHLAYNGSRAAEINYTQALAREVGPYGITVNAILPGLVYTDMAESLWKHVGLKFGSEIAGDDPKTFFDRTVEAMTPLRRPQQPEDIGWMAVYLCSERGRNITGQAINVDGGMRMH
jgi:NAD(P)-dependent dehydrogenase (short-subunit alcohol dehydrogenase family)